MILEKARELGMVLSESEEFKRMLAARTALDADQDVSGMLKEYNDKQGEIVTLLENDTPDTERVSGISNDLDRLQNELMAHPLFIEMMDAQNEFQSLMKSVNNTIAVCIGMDTEEEAEGCTGSCATCGGCKH